MTDAPPPGPGDDPPPPDPRAYADRASFLRAEAAWQAEVDRLHEARLSPAPFAGVGPTGPSFAESFARAGTPADAARAIREQQHPAPWQFNSLDCEVLDANLHPVLWIEDGGMPGQQAGHEYTLAFDSPRVREQLRAAPEMEALLRELQAGISDPVVRQNRIDALLARLDEAAKGGG